MARWQYRKEPDGLLWTATRSDGKTIGPWHKPFVQDHVRRLEKYEHIALSREADEEVKKRKMTLVEYIEHIKRHGGM